MRNFTRTLGRITLCAIPLAMLLASSGCTHSHWPFALNNDSSTCTMQYADNDNATSNAAMAILPHDLIVPNMPHADRDPFASAMPNGLDNEILSSSMAFPDAMSNTPMPMGLDTAPFFGLYGNVPNAQSTRGIAEALPDAAENIRHISFAEVGVDFDPEIAPGGDFYVFSSTRHRPTADIYSSTIGSTAITQLTSDPAHDVMPAISPDGQRIAFASNRNGSWDIYLMSIDGGQAVQITNDTAQELHPSWSPDGRTIAFCRLGETSDRWELWTIDADVPGNMTYLTYGLFPEWQPNGNLIMFQRSRDRGDRFFSVWTIDYERGEALRPTEIASSSVAAIINPTWSWDGRYVAFATVFQSLHPDADTKPDFADIWIQAVDGSGRTNLTGGSFVNVMPTWGPDGRIYFVSDRSGVDNIWSLGPEQAILAAGEMPPSETGLATVPVPKE